MYNKPIDWQSMTDINIEHETANTDKRLKFGQLATVAT